MGFNFEVNRAQGTQGVNYTTNLFGANGVNNTEFEPLLTMNTGEGVDAFKPSTTPGNTGVAESTARGTLKYLDELEQVGL